MLKKDRQPNCYTLAYPKNNVTNILSDPLTKTTDTSPVYSTQNLAPLDTIREGSEVREKECEYSLTQLLPKVVVANYKDFLIYLN
jgi:hypothetical protein